MGRPKKQSDYKAVLSALREKHADKIEDLFLKMYKYAIDKDDDGQTLGVDPKDSVNAAKVCVSLLGVPRTATEKPTPPPPGGNKKDKPTLSPIQEKELDESLGTL
jgi:hypothetical protein